MYFMNHEWDTSHSLKNNGLNDTSITLCDFQTF